MKNSSDTIWNRTSDLPVCRAVPELKSILTNKEVINKINTFYIYIYHIFSKSLQAIEPQSYFVLDGCRVKPRDKTWLSWLEYFLFSLKLNATSCNFLFVQYKLFKREREREMNLHYSRTQFLTLCSTGGR